MDYGGGYAKSREGEEDSALVCEREATDRLYQRITSQGSIWSLLVFCSSFNPSFPVCLQLCTFNINDCLEFVLLEELKEPTVKQIEREEGMDWQKVEEKR